VAAAAGVTVGALLTAVAAGAGVTVGALLTPIGAHAAINYFDTTRIVHKPAQPCAGPVGEDLSERDGCRDGYSNTARCPAGWRVVGGGYAIPDRLFTFLQSLRVIRSRPVARGWRVVVLFDSPTSGRPWQTYGGKVWAVCTR
jgi:hypothetical protein